MSKAAKKKRAQHIRRPGRPQQMRGVEIAMALVDDPYEPGRKIEVARNIRASGLAALYQRGRLGAGDDAEARLHAGVEFQRIYEAAQIGVGKAIDYSSVKVDTSFRYSGLSTTTIGAIRLLAAIRGSVGKHYAVLEAVCGQGVGIYEYAARVDGCSPARRVTSAVTAQLLRALDDLISFFGVAVGAGRKPIPDARGGLTSDVQYG